MKKFIQKFVIAIAAIITVSVFGDMVVSQSAQAASPVTSVLRNGMNVFYGDFLYKGANYGFTLTFNYSASTGRVSNIYYEADGYGAGSKVASGKVTSDGMTLIIEGKASGTYTLIKASASGSGTLKGKMVRGTHNGTCTMRRQ